MRSQLRQEPRLANDGLVGKSADDKLFDGTFSRADDFGVFGFMFSPFSPSEFFTQTPLLRNSYEKEHNDFNGC
jgi:hypothetical protein